jgi:hypothetical protein
MYRWFVLALGLYFDSRRIDFVAYFEEKGSEGMRFEGDGAERLGTWGWVVFLDEGRWWF